MKSFIKPIILASTLLATAISASAHPTDSCGSVGFMIKKQFTPSTCRFEMEAAVIVLGFDGPIYLPFMVFTDGVTEHMLECTKTGELIYFRRAYCTPN